MGYRLEVTDLAHSDLAEIVQYIAQELANPIAAGNLLTEIEKCYAHLVQSPFLYEACRDTRLAKMGYRRAVVQNYLLIYRVDEAEKTVYVLRFFYGRRDYEKLL